MSTISSVFSTVNYDENTKNSLVDIDENDMFSATTANVTNTSHTKSRSKNTQQTVVTFVPFYILCLIVVAIIMYAKSEVRR